MTTEPAAPEIVGVSPDFPVEFDEPFHASLTWEWDDMHMPFALAPLAGDWAKVIGQGFDDWKIVHGFPSRMYAGVFNGWSYYAFSPNASGEEREAHRARALELWRSLMETAEQTWNDEYLPELQAIYAGIRAIDVDGSTGEELAQAWEHAWAGADRAWRIHFHAILAPYQVMEDLADLYESVIPGAPAGESMRLVQGRSDELFRMEADTEALAARAVEAPEVARALRDGSRSLDDLAAVPGGPAFVEAVRSFLEVHGHMGQSVDDLSLRPWRLEPGRLLADVAGRLDGGREGAHERRARLRREADELADGVRAKLADRPDDLARFEHLLDLGRRIGLLTEGHNYWIDRAAQGCIRELAVRVGARLVRDDVLDDPEDVMYLHRREVPEVLRRPADRRVLVAERRALHERQRTMTPPRYVGKAPEETGPGDRFETPAQEAGAEPEVLKGMGASAGVVRGPARVVLTSDEFDRIRPGDVIVCPSSNPSWVPVFTIAGGLVTNTGGVLSHAAVVAREFGLPAVVGCRGATTSIPDGRLVEIDGTAGTIRLL